MGTFTTRPSITMVVEPPPSKLRACHAPSVRRNSASSTSVMPTLLVARPSTVTSHAVCPERDTAMAVRG
ncbi:MAG TPA: hypothetical protein DGD08_16285 [Gemmatimonas aurantiaca]|uniref:Uncharacterized protein n=1 Tax=Gemmatimonas aurantiaca TaxID=173480 RepID=A0A3D4VCE6_9BACT|nr:hypothetical protein [Gemmatimonas aurantiaca]